MEVKQEREIKPRVFICILTYNAPRYVSKTLRSISEHKIDSSDFQQEIFVLDNASGFLTRLLLRRYKKQGLIGNLFFSGENLLFAGGNNELVSRLPEPKNDDLVLLLNSDVEVKSDEWLPWLVSHMTPGVGAVSYGACLDDPVRADGYSILMRRSLFDKYKMNEDYQWFYSMTQLESRILKEGLDIIAVDDHESMLHHFGGKSGNAWQGAEGMNTAREEICSWFDGGGRGGKVIVVPKVQ